MIRIAIADDHPLVITGITMLLSPYKHLLIENTYKSSELLFKGLSRMQPEVLILDILLPDASGKEIAPLIKEKYPDIKILVLTSLDAPVMANIMFRKGCTGYLLKGADPEQLVEAIESVNKGIIYIDACLKEKMALNFILFKEKQSSKPIVPELTQREKEVLELIGAEYTTREIAEKLFLSFHTAENYRNNLIQKLEVKNTAGLIKAGIQLGLIKG